MSREQTEEKEVKIRYGDIGQRLPKLRLVQDFERKSALFSMASAEVILVNLWEHQIGLYQGANSQ